MSLGSLGGFEMSPRLDISPRAVRRRAIFTAILLIVVAVGFGHDAARSEKRGESRELVLRGARMVTRVDSPAEFRKIINVKWTACGFLALAAMLSLGFYWRLREYE
jgi:hypothetical protein